ncbi:hypothetical protein ACLOJK_019200 [Asimina triloba]
MALPPPSSTSDGDVPSSTATADPAPPDNPDDHESANEIPRQIHLHRRQIRSWQPPPVLVSPPISTMPSSLRQIQQRPHLPRLQQLPTARQPITPKNPPNLSHRSPSPIQQLRPDSTSN